jgi:DNA-binding HxlR family transcriptional regulator
MVGSRGIAPLDRSVRVVGRPWTLLIVDVLSGSPCRFSELMTRIPGISSNLLTGRLRQLEQAGVITRVEAPDGMVTRYRLTPLGEELVPVIVTLASWGTRLPSSV